MNVWLVVFCLGVLHVSRSCCAVQQRSNVTDVIGSNELDVVQAGAQRSGRFFPFYTIGRIANVPCTSPSGLSGTCLIAGECKDNGGLASGSCSSRTNQAVCYTKSCGGSTNLNSTYFTNSGFPGPYNGGGTCTFTVNPSSGICQLRIDFRSLTLSQPTGDGSCTTDRLTIVGGSPAVVPICGENTGQHLYLNFAGSSPISLRIATNGDVSFNRLWNIELSQIACASAERAPVGCLQYYTDETGEISSLNYGLGENPALNTVGARGSRQLANTNYGICIRPAAAKCSVSYSLPPNDRYAFTLSDNAIVIDPTLLGSAMLSATGAACTTDFIIIPNPTGLTADRFCGLGFPGVTCKYGTAWRVGTIEAEMLTVSVPSTPTASARPFVVYTVTNGNETPDVANRGFRLLYTQNACSAA
ncbi:AGAP006913-PA [Anopheles gambiae str. PEST]|uniref:AGAP006913-PA n=1 Tax=Anopheles gambiae TaxID=7165 RepID=Q7QIJ9_ANOGA|nr:AGAP006913-PA [Anopheles gambiae str. PEST]